MITLDYVIYDTIANGCLLAFAILIFRDIRFAWFLVLASLIIKIFIYGKYGMFSSFIYLSAQILTSIIAATVWLKEPRYTTSTKQKKLQAIISSLIVLVIWVGLMYKYVNPAIINYEMLFGFDYLCYMLVVIGAVFLCFRLAIGLLFISVEFISYAVNYANSAMVIESAPQYIKDFAPYYWISAVLLFIAGVLLVASYTGAKRKV